MKQIRVYRHPDCAKCARIAKIHRALDWFDRVESTTETPRTGGLRMGEIVVEELATGRISHGADAFAMICRQIPAYAIFRPLNRLPSFRRYMDKELSGCGGGAFKLERPKTNNGNRPHGSV